MNKHRIICAALFLVAALLSGCAVGEAQGGVAEISCELSIFDHEGAVLEATTVNFSEGDSALDVLTDAVSEAKLQIEYTGVGAAMYVQGINNLYEFDEGPESGWIYTVNGERIMESVGAYKPADGDEIIWQYVISNELSDE